ncbi:hypothetical protein BH11PLA2_BH11PLA2_01870 [soil metagenome]
MPGLHRSLRASPRVTPLVLSLPDRLITCLREAEQLPDFPAEHFEELLQTVLRMAQKQTGNTPPFELAAMHPADRLIDSLRQVERDRSLPPNHFAELTATLLRLATVSADRQSVLEAALCGQQIVAGQNAIIRNLARTVIGTNRFLIVDVGALDGWFIDRILAEPRDLHLIAFEPMPDMTTELAKRKDRWPGIELFPLAVGDTPGTLPLRVYPKNPGLSSLLAFEPGYHYFKGHFEPSEFETVDVPVVTLDDHFAAHPHLAAFDNIALKIDVQGFEDRVLRGAANLLASGRVKAILIELVLRPKYAGSWDYLALLRELERLGFVLYDVNPFYRERDMVFQDNGEGRLTEMDCLFVEAEYLKSIS